MEKWQEFQLFAIHGKLDLFGQNYCSRRWKLLTVVKPQQAIRAHHCGSGSSFAVIQYLSGSGSSSTLAQYLSGSGSSFAVAQYHSGSVMAGRMLSRLRLLQTECRGHCLLFFLGFGIFNTCRYHLNWNICLPNRVAKELLFIVLILSSLTNRSCSSGILSLLKTKLCCWVSQWKACLLPLAIGNIIWKHINASIDLEKYRNGGIKS